MWAKVRQNVVQPEENAQAYLQNNYVNNFLIDYYLDCITRRHERNRIKYLIIQSINYFTLISHLVCIFKFSLSFIIELKYETKLYFFEISMFLGGIEKYNKLFLIFVEIFAMVLNLKLRLNKTKGIEEWTQLFQLIRSRVKPFILVRGRDNSILIKILKAAKVLYPLLTVSYIFSGESQF